MKLKNAPVVIAALAAISSASATTLLDIDFDTYTNGNLVGQGSWAQVGASAANPIQVSGGEVVMGQGSAQDASHALSGSVTSGSIFYSLTINVSSKNGTADYGVHLSDGGTTAFGARLYSQSSGTGFHLAWAGSSAAPTTWGADLAFDTDYTIVFQYNIVAGAANDTGALYVTTGSFDPIQANNVAYQTVTTWTGGTEVATFSTANLRQGTNSGNFTADNFVVGTEWNDVVPVPEPATSAMLVGALGAMTWTTRRRRSVA